MNGFSVDGVQRRPAAGVLDLRAISQQITQPAAVMARPVISAPALAQASPLTEPRFRTSLFAFGLVAVTLATTAATTAASASHLNALADTVKDQTPTNSLQIPKSAPTPAAPAAPAVAVAPDSTQLQALLDSFVGANRSNWGIVVKNLKTGETAQVNADKQITSASLYKLFAANATYKAIDNGTLSYGSAARGSRMNVRDCLYYMITISDNACGTALGSMAGWGAMNPALRAAGYNATDLSGVYTQTSAHDVALLYERLYGGTLLSPNSSRAFMDLLKQQRVNNRLPQGLPAGTVFAHKTGDLAGYVHDAGIVFGPKSDYIVVVTSGPWGAPANAAGQFATLSSQLYNYFAR